MTCSDCLWAAARGLLPYAAGHWSQLAIKNLAARVCENLFSSQLCCQVLFLQVLDVDFLLPAVTSQCLVRESSV